MDDFEFDNGGFLDFEPQTKATPFLVGRGSPIPTDLTPTFEDSLDVGFDVEDDEGFTLDFESSGPGLGFSDGFGHDDSSVDLIEEDLGIERPAMSLPNTGPVNSFDTQSEGFKPNVEAAWRTASRMSHYGEAPKAIATYLRATLGKVSRKLWASLMAEHGLAGKVFIRAASFPGIESGKWIPDLRRQCASAKWVLGGTTRVASDLGKIAVSAVPWEQALKVYAPGVRVASNKGAKATLQAALLAPKAKRAAATVTGETEHFLTPIRAKQPGKVASLKEIEAKRQDDAYLAKVAQLVKAKLVNQDQADVLCADHTPREAYLKAATLASQVTVRPYGNGMIAPPPPQKKSKTASFPIVAGQRLIKAARQAMSLGKAGADLDKALEGHDVGAFKHALATTRSVYEYASGHEFVDAGAFYEGDCKRGAALHIDVDAPSVLAFDKCHTCPSNKKGTCTVYDRPVVASFPNLEEIKRDNRQAATEVEAAVANMFKRIPTELDKLNLQSEDSYGLDLGFEARPFEQVTFSPSSRVVLDD